jgi:hypothetical protein
VKCHSNKYSGSWSFFNKRLTKYGGVLVAMPSTEDDSIIKVKVEYIASISHHPCGKDDLTATIDNHQHFIRN